MKAILSLIFILSISVNIYAQTAPDGVPLSSANDKISTINSSNTEGGEKIQNTYRPQNNNQNANPSATVQFCQYEQGWQSGQSGQSGESGQYGQSGQVDHLGQSELQIYTNEQGDEVMRTTPTPQRNNEQGNTYYISPQIYPMPNGHGYPPPHFRPGQKPNPRPKP